MGNFAIAAGDLAPQLASDRVEIKDGRFDLGTQQLALGTIRFSLGHETTDADIDHVVAVFPGIVERARELSSSLGRA